MEPTIVVEQSHYDLSWDHIMLCAGEEVISGAHLQPYANADDRTGYVWSVSTHREHRRKGYARRVMTELIQQARDYGLASLFLYVDGDNDAAQNLYQSLGFSPCPGSSMMQLKLWEEES